MYIYILDIDIYLSHTRTHTLSSSRMYFLRHVYTFNKFIHVKHIYTQHTYSFSNLILRIHVCTSISSGYYSFYPFCSLSFKFPSYNTH